jgi:ankyrin repeat protein
MKTRFAFLLAVVLGAAAFAADPFTDALQKGLLEEEVNHDYAAAAKAYESAVRQADAQRQAGATAVFRLAECYRQLGRTNDALAAYQRVLRDFSGETNLVKLSRGNLIAVGALSRDGSAAGAQSANASAGAGDEAARLAAQLASMERLKDDPEKQARAVLAFFPDDGLMKMLLNVPKLRDQVTLFRSQPDLKTNAFRVSINAEGRADLLSSGSEITAARAQSELDQQLAVIGVRIEFILGIQRARLADLQDAARPATSPADEQSLKEEIKLVEQELIATQRKVENGKAGQDEIRKVRRELLTLQRQLPENAAKDRQVALVEQQIKLADEDLAELRKRIEVGAAPPLDEIPIRRELLSLQRELAAAQRGPGAATATTAAANFGTADAPATKEEAEEIQRIKAIIKDSPDLINARNSDGSGTPLYKAARMGYLAVIEYLLANKADVNAGDSQGNTPLHLAAASGHKRVCEVLLAAGANVNAAGRDGATPLHAAAEHGFVEVAEVLLAKGAQTNTKINGLNNGGLNIGGLTPLHLAAEKGFPAMVELLLKHGGNINAQDTQGNTALMRAMWFGREACARLLVEKGADLSVTDNSGDTALGYAVRFSNPARVGLLLDHDANLEARLPAVYLNKERNEKVESRPDREWTVLFFAVGHGDTNMTRLLLDHGANVNAKAASGITPVHWAVLQNAKDTLKLLLERKPELNVRDRGGNTPLHYAVDAPHFELVAALLAAGADPNLPGWTQGGDQPWFPLMKAVVSIEQSRPLITQALLQHGADVNAKTTNGWTALHQAVQFNQNNQVELLVAAKADVNARGSLPKQTPTLADRNAGETPPGGTPSTGPRTIPVPGFGIPGPMPMMPNSGLFAADQDVTPLHVAVANQSLELVKYLLAHGTDVNARDANGRTPLHFAVNRRDVDLMRVLLEAKADPDARDSAGETVLAMAGKVPNQRVMYPLANRGSLTQDDGTAMIALLREHGVKEPSAPAPAKSIFDTDLEQAKAGGHVAFFGAVRANQYGFRTGPIKKLSQALLEVGLTENARLSNVRVTRVNPETKQPETKTFNLAGIREGQPAEDLVLQDGDHVTVSQ